MQSRRKRYSIVEGLGDRGLMLNSELINSVNTTLIASARSLDVNALDICGDVGTNVDSVTATRSSQKIIDGEMNASGKDLDPRKGSVISLYQDDQSDAEKIDMKLLALDEDKRSHVMYKLVDAFQRKVQQCIDTFSPDLTVSCLRIVVSISALKPINSRAAASSKGQCSHRQKEDTFTTDPFGELDIEEAMSRELPNFTISRLRTTVQQILRRATLRQDGSLYFSGASANAMATKSVQYFIWYFDFMDYLQELHVNFVEKIFSPLFKYFHDFNLLGSNGRTTTMSSTFSKLSQFSNGADLGLFESEQDESDEVDSRMDQGRIRAHAISSLQSLTGKYKDLKAVYDTSEIDKIAQRLSFLKDQLDLLLDEEDEIDPELYSWESGKMIQHLNLDFGTENLVRLMPDILVKLRKAAWLAGRWLELDDMRSKDVDEKLKTIASIEKQLVTRLDSLKENISVGEHRLEQDTNELSRLMDREARSEKLNMSTYSLDERIGQLERDIGALKKERDTFAPKLSEIVRSKDIRAYHKLKFSFESNKLQRLVLERKLASLYYQRNLLEDDINIELFVRPSVIRSANKLQDECEHLEKLLREQREEAVTIQRALVPVQEDKSMLENRASRQLQERTVWLPTIEPKKTPPAMSHNAVYLRSLHRRISPRLQLETKSRPGPTVHSRHFLLRPLPAGNNRALRTHSPPVW